MSVLVLCSTGGSRSAVIRWDIDEKIEMCDKTGKN